MTIVFSGMSILFDKTVVAILTELTRDNGLFCTRDEKNKRKECYCRHTKLQISHTRRGIRCSSVLKSSACKFSDEKMNQIIYSVKIY